MTSVGDLFKGSRFASKRKFESIRDANQIYKSVKAPSGGLWHAQLTGDETKAIPARLPDGKNDEQNGEVGDGEDYGTEPPPDDHGDDEEGRFFGGGISKTESSILDYIEGQDDKQPIQAALARTTNMAAAATVTTAEVLGTVAVSPETYDVAWLRRTALLMEKCITRNTELRARYELQPQKFADSEAALDTEIKALSILGDHPELYVELAQLGTVASLVGLLAHENSDIAVSALEIIGELTDEDVDADEAEWTALVEALLEADLAGLLVSNLRRLETNEADDERDRTGIYYALGIIENLCSTSTGSGGGAGAVLSAREDLVRWLLKRAGSPTAGANHDNVSQNQQYAAEILAILAQAAPVNRRRLSELDAVDTLLQLVAPYRLANPEKGGNEEEYMANLFEALTCLVDVPEGKAKFFEAEGVELCLLMLKDGRISRLPALRLLDHAAGGSDGNDGDGECSGDNSEDSSTESGNIIATTVATEICRHIVEAGGLKTIFTLFLRGDDAHKKHKKNHHNYVAPPQRLGGPTSEHLLSIFASMLRLLPADSPERVRTLAKFVEKDYEKVARLIALREEYSARVAAVDRKMSVTEDGDDDSGDNNDDSRVMERMSWRLDAGLFALQTIDVILAWLVAEDDGLRAKIVVALAEHGETLADLRRSLQERLDSIDPDVADGRDTQEMLAALLEYLPVAEW